MSKGGIFLLLCRFYSIWGRGMTTRSIHPRAGLVSYTILIINSIDSCYSRDCLTKTMQDYAVGKCLVSAQFVRQCIPLLKKIYLRIGLIHNESRFIFKRKNEIPRAPLQVAFVPTCSSFPDQSRNENGAHTSAPPPHSQIRVKFRQPQFWENGPC